MIFLFVILSFTLFSISIRAEEILTWQRAVQEAESKNPDIHAAKAKLKSAEFQTKAAYNGFLPQVTANLNYSRGNTSSTTNGGLPSTTSFNSGNKELYTASLSASEKLFSGFQDKAKINQGKANEDATQANLTSVKAQVSYNLKSVFANLLYAQNSLKLAQEIIQRRTDNLNMIQLRYENGNENKGSLLLSKAYLEQARYDFMIAQDSIRVAQKQLGQVLGRDDINDIRAVGEVPVSSPSFLKKDDVKELIPLTPEAQKAEAERKSAKAAVTVARSPFFPFLTVTGSTGRQDSNFFPDNNRWTVGAGLTWPIFSGGKDYYATKSASADFQASILNQESVRHQVSTKLEQSLSTFAQSVQKLKVDQSFLEASSVREEISRNKYANGLLSFEDWDIIENDLISRQKQVLQSKKDRVISEAAWEQAQGKGVFR